MVCGRALVPESGGGLCMTCAALLEEQAIEQEKAEREERRPPAEGLAYVRAAYPYDGVARRLVLGLKFEGMREAAELLAETMAGLRAGGEELVVPVPTTRRRTFRRPGEERNSSARSGVPATDRAMATSGPARPDASATAPSASRGGTGRKGTCWQREAIVGSTCSALRARSTKMTPSTGSSMVLSSVFCAWGVIFSARRIVTTRYPPS